MSFAGAGGEIPFQIGKVRLRFDWRKDGYLSKETNQMPLYMDRHNVVGATREVIAAAHEKGLGNPGQIRRSLHYVLD